MSMEMFWDTRVWGISFRVCGTKTRSYVYGIKGCQKTYFHIVSSFFKRSSKKVQKNSKTLWQHMKNDHKERINACQKEKSSTRQSKNSSPSCVPWVTKAMISYIGVEPHLKNKLQSGCHCKAQNWNFCINSF